MKSIYISLIFIFISGNIFANEISTSEESESLRWQLKCSVQTKNDQHGWHTVAGASSGPNNACNLAIQECRVAHPQQKCSGMCKVPNSSRPYLCG